MIKNPYTIHPDEIQPGDVFVQTVTIHVNRRDSLGRVLVRAYRCGYPPQVSDDGIPQGNPIAPELLNAILQAFAPTLLDVNAQPDL
jgi:hypothetical protein